MGEMTQLYSRVFLQILDSSIAEDFTTRHVFEDFLKLADHKTGTVDMTRQALARRLNIPLETLNAAIARLESPDPSSRDPEFQGRRLERLDDHRDWGWRVLNWLKYDAIRTRADVAIRVARHRRNVAISEADQRDAVIIYEAYPRKIGRPNALRAITKALKTKPPKELLDATARYARAVSGILEEKFIPHPATWFNQERYNDDPATWAPRGNSSQPHKTSMISADDIIAREKH